MLLLWTVASSCNAVFGQLIWIDHRDVLGGPAQFLADNLSAWYNTLGTVTGICMNFLADGLLVNIIPVRHSARNSKTTAAISVLHNLGLFAENSGAAHFDLLWSHVYVQLSAQETHS